MAPLISVSQIFGAYTSGPNGTWAPSNDPAANSDWYQGMVAFGLAVGKTPNATAIRPCGGLAMSYWAQNLSGILSGIVLSPYATAFVPIIELRLIDQIQYGWNSVEGYRDVANGVWDSVWRGCVDAVWKNGFTYAVIEPGPSYNTPVCDFIGWDIATQTAWREAFSRIAVVIRDQARRRQIRIDTALCPSTTNSPPGAAAGGMRALLPDMTNVSILAVHTSNAYWGAGDINDANNRTDYWNNAAGGYGMSQHILLAQNLGLPVLISDVGSGSNPAGQMHNLQDDPQFWNWLGNSIQYMRSVAVPCWGIVINNVNTMDSNDLFTDNVNQPTCFAQVQANVASKAFVGDIIPDNTPNDGVYIAIPVPLPLGLVTFTGRVPLPSSSLKVAWRTDGTVPNSTDPDVVQAYVDQNANITFALNIGVGGTPGKMYYFLS